MSKHDNQTNPSSPEFDLSAFPYGTLFHDRRSGRERREAGTPEAGPPAKSNPPATTERRAKKDRRRRIDPTTFEKQYSADEMEFMNAMQRFKEQTGKSFPTHSEVLGVAAALGYRRVVYEPDASRDNAVDSKECLAESSAVDAV